MAAPQNATRKPYIAVIAPMGVFTNVQTPRAVRLMASRLDWERMCRTWASSSWPPFSEAASDSASASASAAEIFAVVSAGTPAAVGGGAAGGPAEGGPEMGVGGGKSWATVDDRGREGVPRRAVEGVVGGACSAALQRSEVI